MDAPALQLFCAVNCRTDNLPVRGVGWVLRWAATLAILFVSAVILTAFAYQLAAEQALARAAAAGLREAACERATSRSVDAVIRRQLGSDLARATTIALQRNGSPTTGVVRPRMGDHLTLTLSTPVAVVIPRWMQMLMWSQDSAITQHLNCRFDETEGMKPLMIANDR